MLKLFTGLKGSGKTKHLIELCNEAQKLTTGCVVCLEQGTKLIHEINYQVRLIDTSVYGVDSWQKLYGFICGILAANYDVSDLFIDSALKICSNDLDGFEKFTQSILPLLEKEKINFIMTASIETEKIPEPLKPYLV